MIDQVSPAALSDWFAQHPGTPLVIDVRESHEVAMFSVKPEGAECVFMPMGTIPDRLAELDPKRPTALLCAAGMRSQRVALFLQAQGFDTLANITGGVSAWPA
jgi:rhodanese-related sulfurtransferase